MWTRASTELQILFILQSAHPMNLSAAGPVLSRVSLVSCRRVFRSSYSTGESGGHPEGSAVQGRTGRRTVQDNTEHFPFRTLSEDWNRSRGGRAGVRSGRLIWIVDRLHSDSILSAFHISSSGSSLVRLPSARPIGAERSGSDRTDRRTHPNEMGTRGNCTPRDVQSSVAAPRPLESNLQ